MRILVLCTHNARRSQLAQALLQWSLPAHCSVQSAGTEPAEQVDPHVIEVLREIGVPADGLFPKSVERFAQEHFDLVLTVCDGAREHCPVFPNAARLLHWSLPDPALGSELPEERLQRFRDVRDELLRRIRTELLPLLGMG
jgi:arsenate reductase